MWCVVWCVPRGKLTAQVTSDMVHEVRTVAATSGGSLGSVLTFTSTAALAVEEGKIDK